MGWGANRWAVPLQTPKCNSCAARAALLHLRACSVLRCFPDSPHACWAPFSMLTDHPLSMLHAANQRPAYFTSMRAPPLTCAACHPRSALPGCGEPASTPHGVALLTFHSPFTNSFPGVLPARTRTPLFSSRSACTQV